MPMLSMTANTFIASGMTTSPKATRGERLSNPQQLARCRHHLRQYRGVVLPAGQLHGDCAGEIPIKDLLR